MLISKKTTKIARFLCLVSIAWFSVGEFACADQWIGNSNSNSPTSETSWNVPGNWNAGFGGGAVPLPFADIQFLASGGAAVSNTTIHLDPQLLSRRQVNQLEFEVDQTMLSRNSASVLEISGGIIANSAVGGDITIGGNGVETVDIELSGGFPLTGGASSQTWSSVGASNLVVKNNVTTLQNLGTTTLTFAGNGAGDIQIEGVISDGATATMALRFNDDKTVVLSGANTFSGNSTVSGGIVQLESNTALGIGSVTIEDNATVDPVVQIADGLNVANNFTISDTGNTKTLRLDAAGTAAEFSGDIAINETTAGNFIVASDAGGTLTLSGQLSGERVSIEGGGTVVLTGNNSHAGTDIVGASTARITTNTAAGGSIELIGTNAELQLTNGLNVASSIEYTGTGNNKTIQLTDTGSNAAEISGNIVITESAAARHADVVTGSGDVLTLSGDISGNTLEITRVGAGDEGIVILSGNNTHSTTAVSTGGTVRVASDNGGGGEILLRGSNEELQIAAGVDIQSAVVIDDTGNRKIVSLNETGSTTATISGALVIEETNTEDFDITVGTNDTLTIGGVVSGGGAAGLRKKDSGTLVLTGNNTYTGATNVEAGTLVVNGNQSVATGAVTIDAGATLAGNGTIGGATTISGTHAVGASLGSSVDVQTFSSDLEYTASAVIDWELVADTEAGRGTNFDGIDVSGALTFDAATTFNFIFDDVDFMNSFWQADRQWLVFSGASSVTGFSSSIFDSSAADAASPAEGLFSLDQTGNDIFLNYAFTSAVPEPTTTLLFGIGLGFIGLGRRRRQRLDSAK